MPSWRRRSGCFVQESDSTLPVRRRQLVRVSGRGAAAGAGTACAERMPWNYRGAANAGCRVISWSGRMAGKDRLRPRAGVILKWLQDGLTARRNPETFSASHEWIQNVSRRPLRARFHQRSTDSADAESRSAGVCSPTRMDRRDAGARGQFRAVERKAREQLMEAARRREIDIVLVWRLDRWADRGRTCS